MKIKKLTIQGFKSFVDRVQFTFPSGTSSIVGPNGCGKSNVVDAIRWVTGEHNARNLRGKLMEDLIFNGSETRKPHGMAEVTLTLSNEGGLAPARFADFPEIEIQRRLYRSGDSEYYINKVPARLKDIVELFTDTGIGTNAYSIIEQGQIGWLINAKPIERRVLFEEAAGINKYKQKKDASLRRLDATKLNLTRVNDIIVEVKRQLNSLNRQAKKAERYKKFKTELRALDLNLSKIEYEKLSTDRINAERSLDGLKDKELSINSEIDKIEAQIEEIKVNYLAKEKEFQDIRDKAADTEKRIQSEERTGELLRVRTEEIARNSERLAREIDEFTSEIDALTRDAQNLKTDFEEQTKELEIAAGNRDQAQTALDELTGTMVSRSELLSKEERVALEASTTLSDIKYTMESSIKDEEGFRESEAKARAELNELDSTLNRKKSPLEGLRKDIDASASKKDGFEAALVASSDKLTGLEQKKNDDETRLKKYKEEWAMASARVQTLEEMDKNFEGLEHGVKAIMEAKKSGEQSVHGIHGLIADVIEPQAGYEGAVEA
ncbi:MAG: AAA family ATPase, partial [Thermodesulfobacteriota bacterium]